MAAGLDTVAASSRLEGCLGLRLAPVALAFRSAPPEGTARVGSAGPAGCSYWRRAAEGQTFFTRAEDHFGCPVGAHTHGIELPPAQAQELQGLLGTMFSLSYLRPEELAGIPQRQGPFGVVVYSPLADAPCDPDVVLLSVNARQAMLLAEAAQAAGLEQERPAMGRPTCAILPEAISGQRVSVSLGCIGNRVYTRLGDEGMYVAIPAARLGDLLASLETITHANRELEAFHRSRAGG